MKRFFLGTPSPAAAGWIARSGMLGACALALAGSLWALLAPAGCGTCETASELFGGFNLAALGVAFYAHLLFILALRGPTRYVFGWAAAASGAHLALVGWLFSQRVLCPACLLTGFGAFALIGVGWAMERRRVRALVFLFPVAMTLTAAGVWRLASVDVRALRQQRHMRIALEREAQEPPVAAGRVRLLVYGKPGCRYCQELDEKVLPVIRREFGESLDLTYRRSWKGLLSPTLIIRGQKRTYLRGLPSVARLREAILFAQDQPPRDSARGSVGPGRGGQDELLPKG